MLPNARRLFRKLNPAGKVLLGLIAPVTAIIGTLLALNVIHPFGQDAIASAIERTEGAASAAIGLAFKSAGTEFNASGRFDYRAGRGSLRYDFAGTGPRNVQARFDHRQVYIRLGESTGRRPWVHLDLATAHEELADYADAYGRAAPLRDLSFLGELNFSDPSRALSELRRAGSFEKLGAAKVLGVTTTRYRAEIRPRTGDHERLVASAFIDENDLIRRLSLDSQGGTEPFTLTMDLWNFGAPIDVVLPRQERVRELDDLLSTLLR